MTLRPYIDITRALTTLRVMIFVLLFLEMNEIGNPLITWNGAETGCEICQK